MVASGDERRASQRVEAVVVVQFDAEGRHGVTRDVSERGLLIATPCRFNPRDRLEILIHTPEGPLRRTARVVRVDETPPEEAWRYRVAVELDEPVPPDVIEDGARAAATLLGGASSKPPSGSHPPSSAPPASRPAS